jgi:hypothetical protein
LFFCLSKSLAKLRTLDQGLLQITKLKGRIV